MSALLSPRLREVALDPTTQIVLAAIHGVRWTPPNPRKPHDERSIPYGHVKALAQRFIDGEFGTASIYEVAGDESVNAESLKQSAWKLRKEAGAKRGTAA